MFCLKLCMTGTTIYENALKRSTITIRRSHWQSGLDRDYINVCAPPIVTDTSSTKRSRAHYTWEQQMYSHRWVQAFAPASWQDRQSNCILLEIFDVHRENKRRVKMSVFRRCLGLITLTPLHVRSQTHTKIGFQFVELNPQFNTEYVNSCSLTYTLFQLRVRRCS